MKISRYSVLTSLLALGVVIEALSAVEWASYPYFPDKSLLFARTDSAIFSILAPLSPTFLILLLYNWPVRLAVSLDNQFSKRLKSYISWLTRPLLELRSPVSPNSESRFPQMSRPRLLLSIAIAAAVLLALIPYRHDLNPSMTPIGIDAHYYIDAVNQMLQRAPAAAASYAMGNAWAGSRPLLLIPMYLTAATGLVSVNQTIEALPVILGPLLAVSTFIFVREGSRNERVAGVASLFSALSFNVTVGLWAGFYANWLALAEAYLFLAALLGFLRTASGSKFIIMMLLSFSILLTHPWTWGVVLAVTTIFILAVWRDDRKITFVKAFAVLITINVALDLAKGIVFRGQFAAQGAISSLYGSGVSQSLGFWQNLIGALFFDYNGLLGNAILLGLPVIAMFFLRFRDMFERLLTVWVALGSLPFLALPGGIQTRILYDLPLPILTSVALLILIRPLGNNTAAAKLVFLLILLLSANYALRAVTNLVAVPF